MSLTTLAARMILAGGLGLAATAALADERYAPINNPLVAAECGACHMAFQSVMLPKASWHRIMDGLDNHFGEDASLTPEKGAAIRAYLTANAADSGAWGNRFMRGLDKGAAPLRITELPYWLREHKGEVPASAWTSAKVKSKANCVACHRDANRGLYDDD